MANSSPYTLSKCHMCTFHKEQTPHRLHTPIKGGQSWSKKNDIRKAFNIMWRSICDAVTTQSAHNSRCCRQQITSRIVWVSPRFNSIAQRATKHFKHCNNVALWALQSNAFWFLFTQAKISITSESLWKVHQRTNVKLSLHINSLSLDFIHKDRRNQLHWIPIPRTTYRRYCDKRLKP